MSFNFNWLSKIALGVWMMVVGLGCGTTKTTTTGVKEDQTVVASYGTQKITFGEVVQQLKKSSNPDSSSVEGYKEFLIRYTNFRLKVAEAERLGMDKDSTQQAELEAYRLQLGRPYLLEKEVIMPLAKTLFQRQKEQIVVQHILVRVTGRDTLAAYKKIKSVRDSLLAGADFGKIAVRNSEDPSVANNQGKLPPIMAGRFVQAFEDLCWATPKGQISQITRSPEWGYHLVQVLDRKIAPLPVRSQQIYIRPQGSTTADTTAAYEKAKELYERAKSGEDFGTLARQYADDPYLRQNDGDIGFRVSGELVEPLNSRLFEIKNVGELSEPIRTKLGYHLFKVTDRKPEATFEQAYPELKEQISNMTIVGQKTKALAWSLRQQVKVTFDTHKFDDLMHRFPSDSLFLQFQPLSKLRRAYGNDSYAKVENVEVKIDQFADAAMRQRPNAGQYQPEEARRIAQDVVNDKVLDVYISKMDGLDERFKGLIREYRDGILLFKISEDSLWTKASKDTLALKRYYNTHQAKFNFPERTKVFTFQSNSDSLMTMVHKRLLAGEKAETLAAALKAEANLRFETMFLSDSTNSVYDRAFGLAAGAFTEPMQFLRNKVILISDGKVPPRPKTFEEARAEVTNEYQKQLETAWMNRLYARYKVQFYPEKLQKAVEARKLQQKKPMMEALQK